MTFQTKHTSPWKKIELKIQVKKKNGYSRSGLQEGSRRKHGKTGEIQKNLGFSLIFFFLSSSIKACN